MTDILRREAIYLWFYCTVLLEQIAPFWVLGILTGSVVAVFGKDRIYRLAALLQHQKMGPFGLVVASLLGIASPLCLYGTIPVAASFSQKGLRDDWLAAFMVSSILLNPQLLIYSAALGRTVLLVRFLVCLLCGVTAGLCVRFYYCNRSFFNFAGFAEPVNRDTDPWIGRRIMKNIGRNVRATGGYFLLGIVLAALFQRYVPAPLISNLFGRERGFGVLLAATLGVPLYACGGGTIPLLLEWLQAGMGLGAATAFMITGPATKITNLGAVKTVLGTRHFILYLAFMILFSLSACLIIDRLL